MSAVLKEYEPHGELVPTMLEQQRRESRAAEILQERMGDEDRFEDLLAGIDSTTINPHLFRALQHLDRACYGHQPDVQAVLYNLSRIQTIVKLEAESVWSDECEYLATMEAL
jgi:hypothetical protein